MVSARTLFCTSSPRQNTIMIRSNTNGYTTKRGGYPCKVRRRHRHIRGSHLCPMLLQEPRRASLTYLSPLRRRTSTDHDYVHTGVLQTVIHVRIAGIKACMHARSSSRRLRHRLRTRDGSTHRFVTPGTKNRQSTYRHSAAHSNLHAKPLKKEATTIIANNRIEPRQPTE